ncbi:MAG: leucine/isoleucine/valine transporter permease subunit, partial [Chloroflexi bacterium]|nr:leucine/isoleucine/valine transporter permease subunit [Chloroflexota bacterium]
MGLFSENVGQILQQVFGSRLGRTLVKALFQEKSLNIIPAIVIFLLGFAIAYFNVHKKGQVRWNNLSPQDQKVGRQAGIALGIILLLALPWLVGLFLSQAFFLIGLYIMMGLGLNIVVGYAGLLDLGYVAFFAFGAYTMGVLTTTGELGLTNLNFWMALPICVLAGVLWGVVLGFPVLRMRGDYLAIVTLGFGEIIRILALSDWLAPFEGGAQGILHI